MHADTTAPIVDSVSVTLGRRGRELLAIEPKLRTVVQLARSRMQAKEVWLFGSRARADQRSDSDWDILVVLDDGIPEDALDPVGLWRIGRDAGLIADVVGERISDLRDFEDVVSTLAYDVKREGIRLG